RPPRHSFPRAGGWSGAAEGRGRHRRRGSAPSAVRSDSGCSGGWSSCAARKVRCQGSGSLRSSLVAGFALVERFLNVGDGRQLGFRLLELLFELRILPRGAIEATLETGELVSPGGVSLEGAVFRLQRQIVADLLQLEGDEGSLPGEEGRLRVGGELLQHLLRPGQVGGRLVGSAQDQCEAQLLAGRGGRPEVLLRRADDLHLLLRRRGEQFLEHREVIGQRLGGGGLVIDDGW